MSIERVEPTPTGDERAMLRSWLDWQRATLAYKCAGLSDDELRERSVPPSPLSLLGIVCHLADAERRWFRELVAGEAVEARWSSPEDRDGAFNGVEGVDVTAVFASWDEEIERARAIEAGAPSLDVTCVHPRRGDLSLRWVLVHMVEEYARHNGHADFLRERIDGATGS